MTNVCDAGVGARRVPAEGRHMRGCLWRGSFDPCAQGEAVTTLAELKCGGGGAEKPRVPNLLRLHLLGGEGGGSDGEPLFRLYLWVERSNESSQLEGELMSRFHVIIGEFCLIT